MKRERWEQIDKLLDAALEREADERSAFLDEACAGDEALRREIDSLLSSDGQARSFIEQPAFQVGAEMLTVNQANLTAGQAIGHYRIIRLLGAGGMGEVYLAEDTRLGRQVALKLLPENLTADEHTKRRFIQEARTTSALNHPHIVTIYDIGSEAARHMIAMEYVKGETLRDTLSRGKLEIKRALEVAAQVANGLAAAHNAGIIHRDIKPENLIVTAGGQVKILDFGLAKFTETKITSLLSSGPTAAISAQPDRRVETVAGVILGTVAYMSPEQAEGHPLDHRTDIFSLGVVLYEMLTRERPFQARSPVDTLHAIINQEPPAPLKLNPRLPVEISDILDKTLAKDPDVRYQHAGDFELDLRRLKRAIESNSVASTQVQRAMPSLARRATLAWAGVSAVLLVAVAIAGFMLGRSTVLPPRGISLERVSLTPLTTEPGYEGEPTFSPDGQTLAYVSDRTGNFDVFLKQVSGGPDIQLTTSPADDVQPAFSPDGKQIAFVSSRSGSSDLRYEGYDLPLMGGDIWVMPALGGNARRIAERGNFPSWSPDGSAILYTSGPGFRQKVYRVAASGGAPQEIVSGFEPGRIPRFLLYPSYSSDEQYVLIEGDSPAGFGPRDIYVIRVESGKVQHIAKGIRPIWSADYRAIIYSSAEPGKNYSLWQVAFALEDGRVAGIPEPLTVSRGRDTQPAVSRDGKQIAFAAIEISFNLEVLSFDAEAGQNRGAPSPITTGRKVSYFQSFSPDGGAMVFESHQGAISHLWRVDRGSTPVQLTSDSNFEDTYPRWSPDGQTIAFNRRGAREPDAMLDLWLITNDGANPRMLIEKAGLFSWMPDGRGLIYFSPVDRQLYLFDLTTGSARRLTNEPYIVQIIATSPDGRWVIYHSLKTGDMQFRAVPVAGGEAREVVATSRHGYYHPSFSPSSKWLYFQIDHKNIYRAPGPAQDWRLSAPEKVTNFPESGLFLEDPQISRDGRQLLYSRGHITGDIWIMDLGK